jgi:hypothetical protein
MAEEAAKVKAAVKQKNRTLAVPPTRALVPSRVFTGGAVFCLTADEPSQAPKVCSTTEGGCPGRAEATARFQAVSPPGKGRARTWSSSSARGLGDARRVEAELVVDDRG